MRGMVVLAEEEQDSLVHWGGRNMPVSCLKKAFIELTGFTRDNKLGLPCVGSFNEILVGLVDICKWGYTTGHLDIALTEQREGDEGCLVPAVVSLAQRSWGLSASDSLFLLPYSYCGEKESS